LIDDNGDKYGFSGDYAGGFLIPVSHILPIGPGEKMSRDELLAYWPASHSFNFYEGWLYGFYFDNDTDPQNPLCVWIYANSDGSIDYDSYASIKYYTGHPPGE
jgi:hypothetical protein